MRTPYRNVVEYTELERGDYVLAERKGVDNLAEVRQGTVDGVAEGYGVLFTNGKFANGTGDRPFTFVLLDKGN